MEKQMTRTDLTKENPSGKLKASKHRVEELEMLEVEHQANQKLSQIENEVDIKLFLNLQMMHFC